MTHAKGHAAGFTPVLTSEPRPEVEDVYNLIVGSRFNFVAGGVVAHSFSYFPRTRQLIWRAREAFARPRAQTTPHTAGALPAGG